jgi:hypothetical protein
LDRKLGAFRKSRRFLFFVFASYLGSLIKEWNSLIFYSFQHMKGQVMKNTRIWCGMLAVGALVSVGSPAMADIVYLSGQLTTSSPQAHATGQSTVGTGLQYYEVRPFVVDLTGSYILEMASPNTTGTPSNALDTWIGVFANTFTPPALGAPLTSNDDFTGTLTVLPGPYSSFITSTSTGFSGAQPGSRLAAAALTAGTPYFLYTSSFRDTSFVGTGTTAQPIGPYYFGISGPGTITFVPEPTSLTLLGVVSALGLVRQYRRRQAAAKA